jgi:hypothetical protein
VASAGLFTGGLAMAGAGMKNILDDAVGQDRVTMSSDGSGGGGTTPEPPSNLGDDGMIEPDALNDLSADDILKDDGKVLGKSTGRKMPVRTVRTRRTSTTSGTNSPTVPPNPNPGRR